jgi:hypothetical protein
MAKQPVPAATVSGRANTPEVDEWLQKTNALTVAAIGLTAAPIDQDTAAMMRQVQAGCAVLLTALQRLTLPGA